MTAQRVTSATRRLSDRTALALVLVAIGVILLLGRQVQGFSDYTALAVGIVCLVAFAATRDYGFAVSAGIISGLGVGVILAARTPGDEAGGLFLLSLAGGFAAVWLLGLLADPRETNAWPLVPAVILATIGASILTDTPGLVDWVIAIVAIALVTLGLRSLRQRRTLSN